MRFPKIRLSSVLKVLDIVLSVTGVVRASQGKDPAQWQQVGTVILDMAQGQQNKPPGSDGGFTSG